MPQTQVLSLAWLRVNNHWSQCHAVETEINGNVKGVTLEKIQAVVIGYLYLFYSLVLVVFFISTAVFVLRSI